MNLFVKIETKVLSDYNGILTVAILCDGDLILIFAGPEYEVMRKLDKLFIEE